MATGHDSLADTNGVTLVAHTGESMGAWTAGFSSVAGDFVIFNNRARVNNINTRYVVSGKTVTAGNSFAVIGAYYCVTNANANGIGQITDYNSANGRGYLVRIVSDVLQLVRLDGSNQTVASLVLPTVLKLGDKYMLATLTSWSAGTPTITVLYSFDGVVWMQPFATVVDTGTALTATGQWALRAGAATTGDYGDAIGHHVGGVYWMDQSLFATFLPVRTATNPTQAQFALAPYGAKGAITNAYYKSGTPGFTPGGGNVLSGETAATLTRTVAGGQITAGERQFLIGRVTDASGQVYTPNERLVYLPEKPSLSILFIGDSLIAEGTPYTNLQSVATRVGDILSTRFGQRNVVITNRAVSGTSMGDWAAGGAYMPGALTAASAAGATLCVSNLGINEALNGVVAATYQTRYDNVKSAITGAGMKFLQSYPTSSENGFEPGGGYYSGTQNTLIEQYKTIIDAGVDNITTFAGDKVSSDYLRMYADLYADLLHEDPDGTAVMAANIAFAIAKALGLTDALVSIPTLPPAIGAGGSLIRGGN